ncbi:MAG: helix-turn-helix transcriptional regulator [Paracoccus sp. (in: a-proteobacteria)]|uniref:helix-turn-helix domain-containing protein n=1 Tax=Paracoccus sp. TaxID=267 RepID=UPI0026E02393|nr:helix-turn-helix transcriptional regulator [Paracoccus sp. (in: a-proteobacteria)]MDO5621939.1 helix-turn-helix transcriptional regulator [Paracoccus sp. (in: a-proteobacteria)]
MDLIDYLKSAGVSQSDLARRIGKSRGYLTGIISGRRKPGRDAAFAIERETGGAVAAGIWSQPPTGGDK